MSARLELSDAVLIVGDEEYRPTTENMEALARCLEGLMEDGGGVLICAYPLEVVMTRDIVRCRGKRFRIVPVPDDEAVDGDKEAT